MAMSEEIIIYTTYDSFEADCIVALFESNKIPVYKKMNGSGEFLSIVFGASTTQSIDLIIPAEAEDMAVDLLIGAGYLTEDEENE